MERSNLAKLLVILGLRLCVPSDTSKFTNVRTNELEKRSDLDNKEDGRLTEMLRAQWC